MSEDFVFVGPSLPLAEARELLPEATFLPPVEHGDLLRINAGPGDRVLMIDGLFMLTAPVRHREILALLTDGVMVAGSSSMGALRAAELWRYGMRGVGEVFELFRSGIVDGDDEVAVVHAPAEDNHRLLSEPLVNLRLSLSAAARAGAVSTAEAAELLELCRNLPFRARSPRALRRIATGAAAESADRYATWAQANPMDSKADDARMLLRMAAAGDPSLCPANADDTPIENLNTYLLDAWSTRHRGAEAGHRWVSDARVVGAMMALHPDFPRLHRERVLAELVGADVTASPALVREQALRQAAQKGLVDPDAIRISGWLTETEMALPLADQSLLMIVRAFGTVLCRPMSLRTLPPAMRDPHLMTSVRQFVDSALSMCDQLPHPDPTRPHLRLHFRDEVVERMLCKIWNCDADSLSAVAADRGFDDLEVLRDSVEPYVAWLKMWGMPSFTAAPVKEPELVTAGAVLTQVG
jgi:hypothetical protein